MQEQSLRLSPSSNMCKPCPYIVIQNLIPVPVFLKKDFSFLPLTFGIVVINIVPVTASLE
jgi:hypothetical protein